MGREEGAGSGGLGSVFATAVMHLREIAPVVARQIDGLREKAQRIPSRALRETALGALEKRGNIEGAALFATLSPREHRCAAVRALTCLQATYNYVDALSERAGESPLMNADQLHRALLTALHPSCPEPEYYAYYDGDDDDGGFLTHLVGSCRAAAAELPSFELMAPIAREAAGRIVDFQTLNVAERDGEGGALRSWAEQITARESGLHWWETAAGCGSSLSVHAIIAAAADPASDLDRAKEIDCAYYPFAGSLHSLLDSLVDRDEDRELGLRSLLAHYRTPEYAAIRLGCLAASALVSQEGLRDASAHRVILTAMCSYYLSAPQTNEWQADLIAVALGDVLGPSLRAAMGIFRSKRFAHRLTGYLYV
jgi:tetraprenyl-beta-curcumene synthase